MRGLKGLAFCASIVIVGCAPDRPAAVLAGPEVTTTFEEAFQPVENLRLRASSSNPVGSAMAFTAWGDQYALADGIQSDVKVFGRDGRLVRVIGRPGDGPGEFRSPVSVAALPSGELAVLDARMRLSVFDTLGALLSSKVLPGRRPQQIQVCECVPEGGGLLVSALVPDATGTRYGAYAVSGDGELVLRFHMLPEPRAIDAVRNNFIDVRAVVVGPYIVSLDQTEGCVLRTRYDTGESHWIPIGAEWYTAPTWPQEYMGLQELTDWANRQMWGRTLLALGKGEVLVGYGVFDSQSGSPERRYAIIDPETGRRTVVSDLAPARFVAAKGDTLYEARTSHDGDVNLRVFIRRR
ncbi:MAG: 6-bladed beta-propeller [Gemmatimonadota bacterium]